MDAPTEVWLFVLGVTLAAIGAMALWILNSIKDEVKEISGELRTSITTIDRRVTFLEAGNPGCHQHFRTANGVSENG